MKHKFLMLVALSGLCPGCKCQSDAVSFDTLEEARKAVRDNVTFVANDYRRQNPQYVEYNLYIRGDSTQSDECPMGDGWASVDLRPKNDKDATIKLKCSTVSLALGCMEDNDFKSKSYASEDGVCNRKLPFPIRKMEK